MKPRLAILASGSGTTAEAVILACVSGELPADVGLVISSRSKAGVLERVERLNKHHGLDIATLVINNSSHPPRANETLMQGQQTEAEEAALMEALLDGEYDLILLLGYMRRIGPSLVREFGWHNSRNSLYEARMLNTHPGLLPETKGLHGEHIQAHVLKQQLPYSGQSLHLVADNYDEGPVVAEHTVIVLPNDTPERLFGRVQVVEKQSLPGDIAAYLNRRQQYLRAKGGTSL